MRGLFRFRSGRIFPPPLSPSGGIKGGTWFFPRLVIFLSPPETCQNEPVPPPFFFPSPPLHPGTVTPRLFPPLSLMPFRSPAEKRGGGFVLLGDRESSFLSPRFRRRSSPPPHSSANARRRFGRADHAPPFSIPFFSFFLLLPQTGTNTGRSLLHLLFPSLPRTNFSFIFQPGRLASISFPPVTPQSWKSPAGSPSSSEFTATFFPPFHGNSLSCGVFSSQWHTATMIPFLFPFPPVRALNINDPFRHVSSFSCPEIWNT